MQLNDITGLRVFLKSRLTAMYPTAAALSDRCSSDADPGALADYIIALLKHEKPTAELKLFCVNQLLDFLHERTGPFVEDLFHRIENGATGYDENVEMQAPISEQQQQQQQQSMPSEVEHSRAVLRGLSDEETANGGDSRYRRDRQRSRSRSRSPPSSRGRVSRYDERRHDRYPRRVDHARYHNTRDAPSFPPPFPFPPGGMPHFPMSADGGASRNVRSNRRYQQGHHAGPRSDTRLVIDRIPAEYCSIAHVNDYFQQFGTILNITVHPEIQRARIEYASHDQAKAAYTSPDVIFDNRFVKVYWDHEELPTPSIVKSASSSSVATPLSTPPPPVRSDTVQKRQEALKSVLELQRQKEELMLKYISQQKELLAKLQSKTLSEIENQEIRKALKGVDELIQTLNLSSTMGKEQGRDAQSPSSGASDGPPAATGPILRGGPARGRGGSLRGRGGAASWTSHRLDLRPTALLMKPIPSRVGRDIGSIRKLFEPYGEIKNITLVEENSAVIVSFLRRVDAEKAVFYVPKTDLGEEGLQVSWVSSASPVLSTTSLPADATLSSAPELTPTELLAVEVEQAAGSDEAAEHIPFDSNDGDSHWKR